MTAKEMKALLDQKERDQLYGKIQTLWTCFMNYAIIEDGVIVSAFRRKEDAEAQSIPDGAALINLSKELELDR